MYLRKVWNSEENFEFKFYTLTLLENYIRKALESSFTLVSLLLSII